MACYFNPQSPCWQHHLLISTSGLKAVIAANFTSILRTEVPCFRHHSVLKWHQWRLIVLSLSSRTPHCFVHLKLPVGWERSPSPSSPIVACCSCFDATKSIGVSGGNHYYNWPKILLQADVRCKQLYACACSHVLLLQYLRKASILLGLPCHAHMLFAASILHTSKAESF
jgi:hypothetical protein